MPAFSNFSHSGKEKKSIAAASNLAVRLLETPWLVTLKKPKSMHAATMSAAAVGAARSIAGTLEKEAQGLEDFTRNMSSRDGLVRTPIVVGCRAEERLRGEVSPEGNCM